MVRVEVHHMEGYAEYIRNPHQNASFHSQVVL